MDLSASFAANAAEVDFELPDEVHVDRELASRRLINFFRIAWPFVEKRPLKENWHNGLICEHLEAVERGEIRKLIINIPPGESKSLTVSVLYPAWVWGPFGAPDMRWIHVTYADSIARRDAIRFRSLVTSEWYAERWPDVSLPHQNTRSAKIMRNTEGGLRFSTTVKGSVTGEHADRWVIDDPIKPMDTIGSRGALGTELDGCIAFHDETLTTRTGDVTKVAEILIMQRLHERDLAGHMIAQAAEFGEEIVHLRLPMRHETKYHFVSTVRARDEEGNELDEFLEDPRTEERELLDPVRFPEIEVARIEKRLGVQGAAAQLQQRPVPRGGLTFREEWIRYYGHEGSAFEKLPEIAHQIQVWDMSFKGKSERGAKKRSYVCGQTWGVSGAHMFLLDQERGQWGFVDQCKALRKMSGRRPRAFRKFIEDAANGPAIYNALRSRVPGMKLFPAKDSKESRAEAAAEYFEEGLVWLPHASIAPWIVDLVAELLAFPAGATNDQVDATSHAVVLLGERKAKNFIRAMTEVRAGAMTT